MTEIARGEIRVEVEDRAALAALRRIDAEYERTMRDIDRQKAEADIGVNLDELKRELKQAKAELEKWEKQQANASTRGQRRYRSEMVKKADLQKRFWENEIRLAEKQLAATKKQNRELRTQETRIDAIQRREERRQKVFDALERKRAVARAKESREEEKLARQRERDANKLARIRTREEQQARKAEQLRRKELADIPKLQGQYVRLVERVEKLADARRRAARVGDEREVFKIDIQEAEALAEISRIKAELERRGGPIDLPVNIQPGHDFGLQLRNHILDAHRDRGVRGAATAAGIGIGVAMSQGIGRALSPRNLLVNLPARGLARIGGMLGNLSNMTVRLGPFTATIRQLMLAMSLLGPMIVDLVGSLGALIGVTGSATLGLGALTTAFIGGAIPSALGFFAVLKPLTAQFGSAMKASKALADAELKHGKGSEQAAKKAEELKQVLKGVDKETVNNFKAAGNLSRRWEKLTAPARASAFNVIGKGLRYAADNMGWFAKETNRGFRIAEAGIGRWIKGLDSAEGRDILGTMMRNFHSSLTPLFAALGNLGTYLGRVGKIASGFLPGVVGNFERWTKGLADGAANSEQLFGKIKGVLTSLKSVGNFLMSGGRLMKAFFGGGVESGRRFVDTMSNAMNRWTTMLHTVEGRQSLAQFFDRAVTGAQSLYAAIAPMVRTFVQWSTAISPIASGFMRVVGAVGEFLSAIAEVTALRGSLTALGATLAAMWAVGKVSAFAAAISGVTKGLLGMRTAAQGAAAANAAAGLTGGGTAALGGLASGVATLGANSRAATTQLKGLGSASSTATTKVAATSAAAGAAGGQVGVLRAAATRAVPAIGGMGALAGGAATLGVTALGAAAIYGSYKLLTMKSAGEKASEEFDSLSKSVYAQTAATRQVGQGLGDLGGRYAQARLQVKLAREELSKTKKGTDEHAIALMNYRDAVRQNTQARLDWTKSSESYLKAENKVSDALKKQKDLAKTIREQEQKQRAIGLDRAAEERLAKLKDRYRELGEAAERSRNRMAAAGLNVERAYRGLPAVLGKAQQQLGALARQAPQLGKKIALKFEDPKDAGRVAAKARQALQSGVPKKITSRIVGDSKSAEDAIRRLQRAKITPKKLTILERGGKQAIRTLEQIAGRKLTRKEQRIAQQGGEGVMKLLNRILGYKLPRKELKLAQQGGEAVQRVLSAIQREKLRNKFFSITANAGPALAAIAAVKNTFLPPITQVINVVKRTSGKAEGGMLSEFAATGASADERRQIRAANEAAKRSVVDVRSGGRRISRPTTVVGEENRPEFIIATNPRYRERNLGILRTAARALGTDILAESPMFAAQGYFAPQALPKVPAPIKKRIPRKGARKIKGKKQGRVYRSNNKWMKYVADLSTQQDDWEREASIRESQVQEPEDFITDTGKKTPSGDPIYTVDKGAITSFKRQLIYVQAAYQKLMQIALALIRAVPQAILSANNEINVRKGNISVLNDSIKKSKGQKRRAKDKDKPAIERRIERDVRRKEREQEAIRTLRDDKKNLEGQGKEAGFDYREFSLQYNQQAEEIKAIDPRAKKELADTKPGAGGGSGGTETAAPFSAQAVLVDTERFNVLREFGSNFKPVSPTTPFSTSPTAFKSAASPLAAIGDAIGTSAARSFGSEAASSSLQGSRQAASFGSTPTADFGGGGVAGGSPQTNTKNTTVNNYFTAPPPDPHTWSRGVEFEIGAM